jgi:DNA-binding GntR family transcriptional regulator
MVKHGMNGAGGRDMSRAAPTNRTLTPGLAVGPQLQRIVRERIVRGDLPPGTRISEPEMAAEFCVSRQPVREAFIKLSEEGLLDIRPQRGAYVRKIDVNAVMDGRFVREAVEADIVKLVAADADPAVVRDLRAQIARQADLTGDSIAFIIADETFHRTLAVAAGKAHTWSVTEGLKVRMDRVRHLGARAFPIAKLVIQHGAVCDAIGRRDPPAAETAMRGHLREALTDLPDVAAAMPDFFDRSDLQPRPT